MFASTGKLPDIQNIVASHITGQTYFDFGLFDQCIEIDQSRYCSVFFNVRSTSHDNDIKLKNVKRPAYSHDPVRHNDGVVGFCIPSACSAEDLRSAVAQQMLKAKRNVSMIISSDGNHCQSGGQNSTHSNNDPNKPAIFMM